MRFSEIQLTRYAESLFPRIGPLRAFAKVALVGELGKFLMTDVKVIQGKRGLFVAMPSRRVMDLCPHCGGKNVLSANYCNWCSRILPQIPADKDQKHYSDVFFPLDATSRQAFEAGVLEQYHTAIPVYTGPSKDSE